ncbi:MAG: LCP family protein [Ruminococcus sp.]|nr:LCP family protein [Ruminococcus sp.]
MNNKNNHKKGSQNKASKKKINNVPQKKTSASNKNQLKGTDYSKRLMTKSVVRVKNKFSYKDLLIKICSITLTFVLMLVLILNMPIIDYKKNINGQVINENVSIITYLKRWQPLVDIEGELSAVDITDINEETQKDNDGLDLPQIIEGQYTVLFLGFDESSEMNDVNWLFQFNIGNGTMNVLQIPRDSFMPYYTSSFTGKFNSIYSSGDGEVSPIQRVVNAVQDNFGIPIDAYVTTNCYDIVSIVDLIGGIPMTLEEEMMYEGDKIIPAGYNVLTGEQAEWFVRYRRTFKGEGDIARMKNQRKFLAAAMKKMLNIVEDEGKTKFYGYLKKIYDNRYILTDMSLEEISMLADFGSTLDLEQVQVHLVPGEGAWYYPDGHDKQSVWSVHKQETLDLINANFRPYQIALTPERSAIIELVTDHLTDFNDNSSDNLEDIDNGNTNTPSIDSY